MPIVRWSEGGAFEVPEGFVVGASFSHRDEVSSGMTPDFDPEEFARIAVELEAAPTPVRTAEQIVAYVREQLDADHAGITLIRGRGRAGDDRRD
jgi:hypothetical protein